MFLYFLYFLSFFGLGVSLKLTRDHGLKRPTFCPKEFGGGCDIVKHSKYSWFLGLPMAIWGSFYYVFFIILLSFNFTNSQTAILLYSLAGFVFSARLFFIQKFKIKAYCFWCLLQTICSFVLLVISLINFL